MGKASPIILALDVAEHEKAIQIAESVKDHVWGYKLNWPAILGSGKQIISDIKKLNKPVIADLKLADIGNTLDLISQQVFAQGADYIIGQPFIGSEPFSIFDPKKLILVVEMSHPGATQFIQPLTEQFCSMAREMGVWGVVAPATRPDRVKQIRDWVGPETKILSPGVGAQGGTASETIQAGADLIIVGRAIYNTPDPKQAASCILEAI